jgi:uncharacterized protein
LKARNKGKDFIMTNPEEVEGKRQALSDRLTGLDSLLVAFSGGVDSTFLLAMAHRVLGRNAVACTATSIIYPAREMKEAMAFTRREKIEHIVIPSEVMRLSFFPQNNPDRCYHCKRHLFENLKNLAKQKGLRHVVHAANLDDLKDYRPGWRAAEEMGIIAPLVDAQLTKKEIRLLSKEMGLSTWDKPPMACLASRIPFGQVITEEKLRMIGEAEEFLADLGFLQYRVRCHESLARIELEIGDVQRLMDPAIREKVLCRFKEIGFTFVAMDLEGYISGSLNRTIRSA